MRVTLRNGHLFHDGRFQQADLYVIDGRVRSLVPVTSNQPHSDDPTYDLAGAYVVPGLIDAHAHLVLSTDAQRDESLTTRVLRGARTPAARHPQLHQRRRAHHRTRQLHRRRVH